jgi:integrase
MALHIQKRGEIWHARGTVRIGRETVEVKRFSTGSRSRADAEAVAAAEEARIRSEHFEGSTGRARRLTIADCIVAYGTKAGGIGSYENYTLRRMNEAFGHRSISDAPAALSAWLGERPRLAASTAQRERGALSAALKYGCKALDAGPAPALPAISERRQERIRALHDAERERLLAAYTPAAGAVVLLLAYAGLRSHEAIELDWSNVDLVRAKLLIVGTKSGRVRTVPMHRRVALLLDGMWHGAGRPTRGVVCRNRLGQPYTLSGGLGGNPLKKAHATACRKAGVTDFHLHDWRADFALRFLSQGGDVRMLMQIMGWSTMRMAERYVTYRVEHLADVMDRLG